MTATKHWPSDACCLSRYGTFSELAGIDPTDWRAAAAGLPPIDSHSLVPVLMGTGKSLRTEVPVGTEPRLLPMYLFIWILRLQNDLMIVE